MLGILMSKIIKIGQLFLNLYPVIRVDVFFSETRCIWCSAKFISIS